MAALLRRLRQDDRGTTLAELLVGMAVMGVFMTIFTGAVVTMARTTTEVEAVTGSAAQVNNAFLQLDEQVRYADAITTVGPATGTSGDSYVELSSVNSATSVETCTQLRVDIGTQKLQRRTWVATSATAYAALSPWTTLASFVLPRDADGVAYQPFAAPPPPGGAVTTTFQRLTITLVAGTSGPGSTSTTSTNMTFTALNSDASDPTNEVKCQQLPAAVRRP